MGFTVCHITLSSNLIFKITHICAHTHTHTQEAQGLGVSQRSLHAHVCAVSFSPRTRRAHLRARWLRLTLASRDAALLAREPPSSRARGRVTGAPARRGVKQHDQVPGRAAMCPKPTPLYRAASRHRRDRPRDRPRGSAGLPLRMPAPSRTCDLPSKPKGGGHT